MGSLTRCISTVITVSNRFVLLSNLRDALIIANSDDNRRQIASKKCAIPSKKKHKIIVLGDSQVKDCLRRFVSLDSSCSVMSLSKPSADWDTIITPSHYKTDNFLKNDVIIVCGRTRDISNSDTNEGLRCFKQFAMKTSNTNVIILDAPHLHDLQEKLCVSKEVIILSSKLCKLTKSFQHVQLLITNMIGNLLMKHGLHSNSSGISGTFGIIEKSVCVLSSTKQGSPPRNLALPYERESSLKHVRVLQSSVISKPWHITGERSNINVNQVRPTLQNSEQPPLRRKNPINKNYDFLWT